MDRFHPRSEAGIGDGLRRRADDDDVAHRLLTAQPLLHQIDRLLRLRRADEVALGGQRVGQQRPSQHDANHRRNQPHPDCPPRMLRAPPRDSRRHTHRRPPCICFKPSTRGAEFPTCWEALQLGAWASAGRGAPGGMENGERARPETEPPRRSCTDPDCLIASAAHERRHGKTRTRSGRSAVWLESNGGHHGQGTPCSSGAVAIVAGQHEPLRRPAGIDDADSEPPQASTENAGDSSPDQFDVAVVGSGQAGLAIGYWLAKQGRRFVILEAGDSVATAWRKRWDSLVLFTSRRYDALPGLAFPGDPDGYPTRDEVIAYLERYASEFNLPVQTNSHVRALTVQEDWFVLDLGERRIRAKQVVVATGPFQAPRTPALGWLSRSGRVPDPQQRIPAALRHTRGNRARCGRWKHRLSDRQGTDRDP